jgi:hypothetical protein
MRNCVIFLFALLFATAYGHSAFTCPVARSTDTGIKGPYPCGSYPETAPTIVPPGPYTFTIYETISHSGAPWRIALSIGNDSNFDSYILWDHIPHMFQSETPKNIAFNINIPNINCTKCTLGLINIMTDKIGLGNQCTYPYGVVSNVCFSAYHSCSDVIINGTGDINTFQSTYVYIPPAGFNSRPTGNYTQESAAWTKDSYGIYWMIGETNTYNSACALELRGTSGTSSVHRPSSSVSITFNFQLVAILLFVTLRIFN